MRKQLAGTVIARLPTPVLAERLLAWFITRQVHQAVLPIQSTAEAKLWPGDWAERRRGAEMLRIDLKAAGIEFATTAGRADFHALRTSFVTRLARSGVSLVEAQRLARHSSPTLTARHYTKLELCDLSAAVERLPVATVPPEALQATGTDNATANRSVLVAPLVAPADEILCDSVRTDEHAAAASSTDASLRNALPLLTVENDYTRLCIASRDDAESYPARIRT